MIRLVTWNINGLRAWTKRAPQNSVKTLLSTLQADIACFQVTISGLLNLICAGNKTKPGSVR